MKCLASSNIFTTEFEKEICSFLSEKLNKYQGTCGYKITTLGIEEDKNSKIENERIPSFMIVSKEHGVILIDVVNDKIKKISGESGEFWITEKSSEIYSRDIILDDFESEVENRLKQNVNIFDRRNKKLKIPIKKLLLFPFNDNKELKNLDEQFEIINETISNNDLLNELESFFETNLTTEIDVKVFDITISLLDGSNIYATSKKTSIQKGKLETKNDFIEKSLEEIYKLDEVQRQIALQMPNSIERIRGLAGTGKTIILSMKAGLAHKNKRDWKILFVFNTKSLIYFIKGLIEKYYIKERREAPNWENLEVLHAWGGRDLKGLYSEICKTYNIKPLIFNDVRFSKDPLEAIYKDLLSKIKRKIEPVYDLVLIDEAQDFSPALFEIIFYLTKKPKRIVWAYDEFQSLKELNIKEPEELFGKDINGKLNITNNKLVFNESDLILPNSYRNPRINLMLAHGFALGLYSKKGIIDILHTKKDWEAIGYDVIEPKYTFKFNENDKIILERKEENSKNKLEKLLKENARDERELVNFNSFNSIEEELNYVRNEIFKLVTENEINPKNIFVITLDTKNSNEHLSRLRQKLNEKNIKAIMPGYGSEKVENFNVENRVTLTTAFRAKGNEVSIVFIINTQEVSRDFTFRKRNALFVSITRSRGWCYMSGNRSGDIDSLKEEFDKIILNYPKFEFIFPRDEDLKRKREILAQSDIEIEKAEEEINNLKMKHKSLLIENIKNDPELLREAIQSSPELLKELLKK